MPTCAPSYSTSPLIIIQQYRFKLADHSVPANHGIFRNKRLTSHLWSLLREQLAEVELYKRSFVSIDDLFIIGNDSVGKVYPLISKVIDRCLEISAFHSRHDVANCILDCDVSVVLVEELIQAEVKRGAHPVHSVVNYIFYRGVPGIILRQQVGIIDNVEDAVAVLEGTEIVYLTVSHSQDQVAGSFRRFQPADRFIERGVPLQNVSEDEGEGISEPALLPEGFINEIDADLADGQSLRIDSGDDSDPAVEADVEPRITVLLTGGMVDCDEGVLPKRAIHVLSHKRDTQSSARSWIAFWSGVALPQAPNIEQVPFVSSPIMWMRRINFKGTPLASAIPRISSQYFLFVNGSVISQVRSRAVPATSPQAGFFKNAGSFFGRASSNSVLRYSQTSGIILLSSSFSSVPWANPIWYMSPQTWSSFVAVDPSPTSKSLPCWWTLSRRGSPVQVGFRLMTLAPGCPWHSAARMQAMRAKPRRTLKLIMQLKD